MNTTSTVVVTGGGTGIGRAIAETFLPAGRVIALGMDRDDDLPAGIEFRKTDVASVESVRAVFRELDRVDCLVNCAGVILHEGREFDPDGFRKVVDINLCGSQITMAEAHAKLVSSAGAVVNVASMWSYFGSRNNPAYAASKAGVLGLTRSYAVALAEEGVRVNAVAPGWIRTRLSAGALENPERSAAIMARLPMKRWGVPQDIAGAVRFLCSVDARYITGVVLPVDGGYGIA
ncbi:SDR family NAD(P)-dependent oxidoreductase [Burkholderia anthina]|uniref:2-deoxy-D-gluconate 3-dehydrogenase n=1 Tax=Burkholderia anthina TaxID=179879 RepID=A0A6P2G9X0_9BURK|nr:SDR family oxidoreductase [Burkholderia anthina]MBM2766291.1 SDR family oxidoreductase [Burkholderia anthina]VVU50468.1 2-deoxy-D-gluconate 3-dehydrogenase [Burkholderia anthina]